MAQKAVIDLLAPIAQICLGCPNPIMVLAYVDAVRRFCQITKFLKTTLLGATIAPVLSAYTTGTVAVVIGDGDIVGTGTLWLLNVKAGDTFTGPDGEDYVVQNVTDDTHMAVTSPYAGASLSGQAYSIQRNRYTSVYDLGSDNFNEVIGITAISITGTDGRTEPLTPRQSSDQDGNDAADQPEFYDYIPHAQFALHPKPDAVYQLQISLILQPVRESNSVDASLITLNDETFRRGALSYLLAMPNVKWSNPKMALINEQMFIYDCKVAAMTVSVGNNPGALPTDRPGGNYAMPRARIHPLS